MADISDVLNGLVTVISGVIYPNGTSQPSVISVTGVPQTVRVYPGWPTSSIDGDLAMAAGWKPNQAYAAGAEVANGGGTYLIVTPGTSGSSGGPTGNATTIHDGTCVWQCVGPAGIANVSVFPTAMEQNTTRYFRDWNQLTAANQTIIASVAGTVATFTGTPSVPQNIAALVNNVPFVYGLNSSDTLDSAVAALAALINAQFSATANGNTISIPSATKLIARTGGAAVEFSKIRRQSHVVSIDVWCNTPAQRDAVAAPVDVALADIIFMANPDGTSTWLRYLRTTYDDRPQKANMYRRTLMYRCEFDTIETMSAPQVVVAELTLQGGAAPIPDFTGSFPPIETIEG